jgi:hypothetical protein
MFENVFTVKERLHYCRFIRLAAKINYMSLLCGAADFGGVYAARKLLVIDIL